MLTRQGQKTRLIWRVEDAANSHQLSDGHHNNEVSYML